MKLAVMAFFLAGVLSQSRIANEQTVTRSVFLMGTTATLHVRSHGRDVGIRQIERGVARLEEAEAELSTWRPDSALGRINREPVGSTVSVARGICDLLDELRAWSEGTGGAFDPAVGALIDLWALHAGGRAASRSEIDRALERSGIDKLKLDRSSNSCRVVRERDVRLDSGAFGKGAGLDRVSDDLISDPWMIDLGGQIAVGGQGKWTVSLSHPRRRWEEVRTVVLESGSLATSGGSEHDVEFGEETLGHIVDPRTGRTVVSDASVAVWHPHALLADVLSTALYVMGPDEGLSWAEERGIAAVFLIPRDPGEGDGVDLRASSSFLIEFPEIESPSRVR